MVAVAVGAATALCRFDPGAGWSLGPAATPEDRSLLELYLPLCSVGPEAPLTVAHLGQSLDGHIATASGDSYYVTGPPNLRHLHRMRALCDAVLVGAETVVHDNPKLTTRRAAGANPVRVVLDPKRRLSDQFHVFRDDAAPTLLICDERYAERGATLGHASVVGVPVDRGRLRLDTLLAKLHASELHAVFVEGGGATVSSFLEAGLLDRLHVTIAPLVTGKGRSGLRLPARERLGDALRPAHRVFRMGDDILFDCDLRAAPGRPSGEALVELVRIL